MVFKTARHLNLPWNSFIHCTPNQLGFSISILILSSSLGTVLQSGILLSGFPQMSLYIFLRHVCYMFRPSNRQKFDHPEKYLVNTAKHVVPHYADFSVFLLFPFSWCEISSADSLFSNTLGLWPFPYVTDKVWYHYDSAILQFKLF